jgi:hypothetical protein
MSASLQMIRSKELASQFRMSLELCEVPALVRAARDGAGVRISSKRGRKFSESEQRTVIQAAALMSLHHCSPEFGAWPVQPTDRGHPETFSFWSE